MPITVQRLLDTLACDEVEVRRRLVELTRAITVLRVNEKILARKYTIARQTETGLRQVMMHIVVAASELFRNYYYYYHLTASFPGQPG